MKVHFDNGLGTKLCGVLSEAGKDIVIMCHGFSSGKESESYTMLEGIFNRSGLSTLRFDFFGHGESGGRFENVTVSEAVRDALQAIKFVEAKFDKVYLTGTSFGGIAATLAASRTKRLSALVLKCPVSKYAGGSIEKWDEKAVAEWERNGFIYFKTHENVDRKLNYSFYRDAIKHDVYKEAEKISIPALIIHGDKDNIVPLEQSIELQKHIRNSRLFVMKGGDHHFTGKKAEANKMMADFIIEVDRKNKTVE